ncbi:MAG TPA: hypothetical protein DEQ02_07645 [Ruminococcaceae bacterium]|nr:hypothetical protein [Oscillospiraceae bacterium]
MSFESASFCEFALFDKFVRVFSLVMTIRWKPFSFVESRFPRAVFIQTIELQQQREYRIPFANNYAMTCLQ